MENMIELKKPYVFDDEEYKSIDLSGLENLTMQDAIDAGMIYGTVDLTVPEQAKTIFAIIQGNFDAGAEMPKEKVCYLPQSPYTK